jgi:GT2 family glycosyltransferase/glycosyltransferase involved in cell wall biosynthesis
MAGNDLIRRVLRVLAPEGTVRRDLAVLLRNHARAIKHPVLDRVARFIATRSWAANWRRRAWYRQTAPSAQLLHEQRHRFWPRSRPCISLLIPVRTRRDVRQALRTIEKQTYTHWEVVFIVDAARADRLHRGLGRADDRVVFVEARAGAPVEHHLDAGRQLATGEFIGVLSAGDTLSPHALAELADHLLHNPGTDVVYCDEDCVSAGGRRHGLHLKPDWSPEMLLGFNYVGRLCLIRRDLLDRVGGFDGTFGGAQEYEALLRVSETAARFSRVPLCLYHRQSRPAPRWRVMRESGSPAQRERALRDHLRRRGHAATVTTSAAGLHRVAWPVADPPLVSIIIPTRDQPTVLKQCVEDLRRGTDYPRIEIILVDNGSRDAEVLDYYRELTAAGAATVVPFDVAFNYSAACNRGARHAAGELLLFLNNDISVIRPDWLTELVRFAVLPGVGCVGTKLLYPNGVVQHAGVVIGLHMCGLVYNQVAAGRWDEFGSPDMYRNLLAIMGACQLIPRRAFDAVGGFDERYRIANSDVAICLRLHRAGLRTVYTPHAALTHHEGLTRGKTNPAEDVELTAFDLRELRIDEDPYFHPALSPHLATPTLRLPPEPSPKDFLRAQTDAFCRIPRLGTRPDIYNEVAMREFLGAAAGLPTWHPAGGVADAWDAAQLALSLLRTSPSLRARFPRALTDGVDGAYCRWLCEDELPRLGREAAAGHVRAAFSSNPGARVRQLYGAQPGLRTAFPGATLAIGRSDFHRWLATYGKAEYCFRDEEIWWFMLQCAEDPVAELMYEYSVSPAWQAGFPDAMTDLGWPRFYRWVRPHFLPAADPLDPPAFRSPLGPLEQLRVVYECRPHWRRAVPDAFHAPHALPRLVDWLADPGNRGPGEFDPVWLERVRGAVAAGDRPAAGVNVLGHFTYPSGLQVSVMSVVESLRRLAYPTACHDVTIPAVMEGAFVPTRIHETYDVTLIHAQPEPYFDTAYRQARLRREPDRYRIGMWYWEFGAVPDDWSKQARLLNELWAPTHFIAGALAKSIDLPVVPMLPGLELGEVRPVPRSRFGIPDDKLLFLFVYDMKSIQERKNPLGLIEAYRRAFRPDDRVHLAIKVSSGETNRREYARVLKAAHAAGVQVINSILPRGEAYGLMQCCDCYVSLHRSEGLGLTMAEAMLLGKPVVATGYSGNTDFMTADDSLLVDYSLVPVGRDIGPYKADWLWAEPSVDDAVARMRWVYEHRDEARALGERAKAAAERVLSMKAAGDRLLSRLREIEAMRNGTAARQLAA